MIYLYMIIYPTLQRARSVNSRLINFKLNFETNKQTHLLFTS